MIKLLFKIVMVGVVVFLGWTTVKKFTSGGDADDAPAARLCEQVLGEGENSDKCRNLLDGIDDVIGTRICSSFKEGEIGESSYNQARNWVASRFKEHQARFTQEVLDAYYRYKHDSICGESSEGTQLTTATAATRTVVTKRAAGSGR